MNHTDRDKYLTEKVLGECWHEGPLEGMVCSCGNPWVRCNTENNDFSTGNGFIKLWNACQEKEWWREFYGDTFWDCPNEFTHINILDEFVNPDKFADAVYEFLKEREDDRSR